MLAVMTGFDPTKRGYHAVYRDNEVNHCPGCGRTHWLVGRRSAECAFCATALPLADSGQFSEAPQITSRGHGGGRVQ
jgi:hypothetical protein